MYFDSVTCEGVSGCLLKVDALQGLDRFEEAVTECEQYIAFIKGKGSSIHLYTVILTLTLILTATVTVTLTCDRDCGRGCAFYQ
jgi:hypothetical protein